MEKSTMKIAITSFLSLSLFLVGCSTVPESVQKVVEQKQIGIMSMHGELAKYNAENQIEVIVKLPPGSYTVEQSEGFEIASVSIPRDMTATSLAAYNAIGRINIPENVAISAIRALTPLAGFAIGAWQNVAINRDNNDLTKSLASGAYGVAETSTNNWQPSFVVPEGFAIDSGGETFSTIPEPSE
jgi:hypothetical protein